MTSNEEMQSRAEFENGVAFEAAVKSMPTWTPDQAFERNEHDEYVVKEIRDMWRGYKAGLQASRASSERGVSLEKCARAVFESRYPFSWDVCSKRSDSENLGIEAHQCRRDAKALLTAAGIKFTDDSKGEMR